MTPTGKRIRTIAAVLVLLILTYFLSIKAGSWLQTSSPRSSIQYAEAARIRISGHVTISLGKQGKIWKVEEGGQVYPADPEKVGALLSALNSIRTSDIVSNNKKKRTEFGIKNDTITVTLPEKTEILHLGIPPTTEGMYVSINDESEIYAVPSLSTVLSDDYRDLKPVSMKSEDVVAIHEAYESADIDLIKDKNGWTINAKRSVPERVDYFISDITGLKASTMDMGDIGAKVPDILVRIEGKSQTTEKLEFFQVDETTYVLRTSHSPFTYSIPAGYVESLKKSETDFLQ